MSIFNENKFDYFYDNLYDNFLSISYDLTFWQKEWMYYDEKKMQSHEMIRKRRL
jgi:hypothetical protein